MKFTLVSIFLAASLGSQLAGAQGSQKISMVFNNTDVSVVLKAIGLRTHANIIYSGNEKLPVSLNVSVDTAEQAIQSVAAASGLLYRKVDRLFVIAAPKDMKQALAPYGYPVTFTPGEGNTAQLVQRLQDSVPYASFSQMGEKIEMTGVLEDIQQVRRYIDEYRLHGAENRTMSDVEPLRFGNASQIAPLVTSLFPNLKVSSPSGDTGGAIALSGSELEVQAAERAIAKLDQPAGGAGGAAVLKLYSLKYISAPEAVTFLKKAIPEIDAVAGPEVYEVPKPKFNPLSASIGAGSQFFGSSSGGSTGTSTTGQNQGGVTGGQGQTIVKPGDRARTVVLRGPGSSVDEALAILSKVDVRPRQIVVECKVLEVSPSFTENLGLNWNLTNTQTITEGAPGAAGIGFGTFTRTTPLSFSATLQASETKGEAKLLADPRIQASDNEDAFIFVGQTVNVAITAVGALGADSTTTQSYPVGIILTIRPRVGADGSITMHVNPVVSTITSIDSNGLPQIASREAETTAVIRDGQTMAIGGLIQDNLTKTTTEVPLLSQIPFLGELFKFRNTEHTKIDVLVTLTPHLVPDQEVK